MLEIAALLKMSMPSWMRAQLSVLAV